MCPGLRSTAVDLLCCGSEKSWAAADGSRELWVNLVQLLIKQGH